MPTEVWLLGTKGGGAPPIIGKVRLVDPRGGEITESANHSIKTTLQEQTENIVGKIILSDEKGVELPLIQTLINGINVNNSVKVATKTVSCPVDPKEIPGIGAGVAYATGEAFGTVFRIDVPTSGVIMSATYWDLDDEGLQADFEIFKHEIPVTTDNAAWAPVDATLLNFVTELSFFAFDDHGNSQTSEINNIGKAYTAPEGRFWIQQIARGAQNIAAGNIPRFQLQILSDDPDWR